MNLTSRNRRNTTANLFITPAARELLFKEGGTLIVKDSSANKCGVICSSYEILSSFLTTQSEFLENKEDIVEGVLTRLRDLARVEAKLLLREYAKDTSVSLPRASQRISDAIIRTHDTIYASLVAEVSERRRKGEEECNPEEEKK